MTDYRIARMSREQLSEAIRIARVEFPNTLWRKLLLREWALRRGRHTELAAPRPH
jgi:hypothetical protein